MQISPRKNQNSEKPYRNPSNRTKVKILGKNFLDISQKKFGSAYAQSPQKCSNIEILAKIEEKEAKFFSKIYEGHIRIWFRSKKNSKLSHACVPLSFPVRVLIYVVSSHPPPNVWTLYLLQKLPQCNLPAIYFWRSAFLHLIVSYTFPIYSFYVSQHKHKQKEDCKWVAGKNVIVCPTDH